MYGYYRPTLSSELNDKLEEQKRLIKQLVDCMISVCIIRVFCHKCNVFVTCFFICIGSKASLNVLLFLDIFPHICNASQDYLSYYEVSMNHLIDD